jgi:hypothetical protein
MISKKNYKTRIESLRARRKDDLTKSIIVSEAFNKSTYTETIRYVYESMQEIDPAYTKKTYEACDKIKNHLTPGLTEAGISVDYDYQGSVPTNTHIKLYSDIDLLAINTEFETLQLPQVTPFPYQGNPVEELKKMRKKAFQILDTVYSACKIDDTHSKALRISGGTLNRHIDIVFCNHYNSNEYEKTKNKYYRGINVLDRDRDRRIINYPFAHIQHINAKDVRVNGNEKRLIRFLKTLKIDAKEESGIAINLSSYDIASLVFRMEDSQLTLSPSKRLLLLNNCRTFFNKVITDKTFRDSLKVANGTRDIFCDEGAQLSELVKLNNELNDVITDILYESKPIFDTLEKAEINYF